jgi:hypothetical protein
MTTAPQYDATAATDMSHCLDTVGEMKKIISTPEEFFEEMRRRDEEGEPLILVPINDEGEPSGEPPIVSWPDPQGRRLN